MHRAYRTPTVAVGTVRDTAAKHQMLQLLQSWTVLALSTEDAEVKHWMLSVRPVWIETVTTARSVAARYPTHLIPRTCVVIAHGVAGTMVAMSHGHQHEDPLATPLCTLTQA